jgi:hypothetical protein
MGYFCCGNNHDFYNQLQEDVFTEEEQEEYTLMVFLGVISLTNPSPNYTFRIISTFERALIEGYGATLRDLVPGTPDYSLFQSFRQDLLSFTDAKQLQQIREMSQYLGLDREDFIIQGGEVFNKFNGSYLKAEYETTVNTAKAGKRWNEFVKNEKTKPMLKYKTQEDSRVRIDHRIFNNITRPLNDPFWDLYYPPNGWNCRCFVINSSTDEPTTNIPIDEISRDTPEIFKFNPGKTGYVFSPNHPYYKGISKSIPDVTTRIK